jgi:hypothetical protein
VVVVSRVSLLEQLYTPKKKSALEFDYDKLWAPPIRCLLSQQDINELYKIATSLRNNGDIEKKYELIDAIMKPRGFRRGNRGTNRVVYNFLEDTSFCMKIALDRVGIKDSPAEFKNQEFFKPFCCKIFEVDPTGVISCIERVNPISSLEEFMSISDDVFNMMVTKIIGKYVVDDLGTEKFMNYGIRYNSNGVAFGPVVIDYPYAYELDGAKLYCTKPIQTSMGIIPCHGEIDYDAGMNHLKCTKCGKPYTARELAKNDANVIKFYSDEQKGVQRTMRARIVRKSDNTILYDSGRTSNVYVSKEEYEEGNRVFSVDSLEPRKVVKSIKSKYIPLKQHRREYYSELQAKAYEAMQKNEELFNPVIESENKPTPAKRAKSNEEVVVKTDENESYSSLAPTCAKRAEDINNETPVVDERKTESEEHVVADTHKSDDSRVNSQEGATITEVDMKSLEEELDAYVRSITEAQDCNESEPEDETADTVSTIKSLEEELNKCEESIVVSPMAQCNKEKDEEDDSSEGKEFDDKLELEAFPELGNIDLMKPKVVFNEPDYSNYEPEESDDEGGEEDNRSNRKMNRNKHPIVDDDMSEY